MCLIMYKLEPTMNIVGSIFFISVLNGLSRSSTLE